MSTKRKKKSPISKFYDTKHAIEHLLTELDELCENDFGITPETITEEHVKLLGLYEEKLLEIAMNARNSTQKSFPGELTNDTTH